MREFGTKEEKKMKKFTIREFVTIERKITVEANSITEVRENYKNGDYDEKLEECYFDGQYTEVYCNIESDDENYVVLDKNSGWDGHCPYCGSSNVDLVDETDGDAKYICRCCNEDFLFDKETGKCTDRHRRPIRKED